MSNSNTIVPNTIVPNNAFVIDGVIIGNQVKLTTFIINGANVLTDNIFIDNNNDNDVINNINLDILKKNIINMIQNKSVTNKKDIDEQPKSEKQQSKNILPEKQHKNEQKNQESTLPVTLQKRKSYSNIHSIKKESTNNDKAKDDINIEKEIKTFNYKLHAWNK